MWVLLQVRAVWGHEGHEHSDAPRAPETASAATSFLDQLTGSGVAGVSMLAAIVGLVCVAGFLLVVAFGSRR